LDAKDVGQSVSFFGIHYLAPNNAIILSSNQLAIEDSTFNTNILKIYSNQYHFLTTASNPRPIFNIMTLKYQSNNQ